MADPKKPTNRDYATDAALHSMDAARFALAGAIKALEPFQDQMVQAVQVDGQPQVSKQVYLHDAAVQCHRALTKMMMPFFKQAAPQAEPEKVEADKPPLKIVMD